MMYGDMSVLLNISVLTYLISFIIYFIIPVLLGFFVWTLVWSIVYFIICGYNAYVIYKNKNLIASNFIFSNTLGEYFNEFAEITANTYEREGLVGTHWDKIAEIPEIAENLRVGYSTIKFTIMFYNKQYLNRTKFYAILNIVIFMAVSLLVFIAALIRYA